MLSDERVSYTSLNFPGILHQRSEEHQTLDFPLLKLRKIACGGAKQ